MQFKFNLQSLFIFTYLVVVLSTGVFLHCLRNSELLQYQTGALNVLWNLAFWTFTI